ncbi:aminotransferase class I/II-fold pyridoxal phosphate-dependent enzyme, partial [bacterium]|nr:aminotransferase class I/II-fold pyridoxal phosphate-dependent enzyme [bacterium]
MWEERLDASLESLRAAGQWRKVSLPEGVCFSNNDYLGLASHPAIAEAGRRVLENGECGARGSRLLGGHTVLVEETEHALADYFGAPQAVFFSSGYLANLGAACALARLAEAVASDAENHASLIDGIRLSARSREVVPHQEWAAWQPGAAGPWLLVAESLYSMGGDTVDEVALRGAWDRSQGFLLLDEAHAAGVLGPGGRGVSAPWRDWTRMAVVVTFGKAFGGSGGAVLCSAKVRDWLVNTARPFIAHAIERRVKWIWSADHAR